MSAEEAIAALDIMWPGWVEHPRQKDFVFSWYNIIQKRKAILSSVVPEPLPCPLQIHGDLTGECNLFLLVGMPGSGKSWFSRALLVRNPTGWACIPQNIFENGLLCETELSRARGRVLIDGCNASVTDRESWLKLASRRAMAPVCVYFDYDAKLCCYRAQSRVGHRTLPPGSKVRHAIAEWQKAFEQPSLNEGYKALAIVRSFIAAEELVARLSPPVGLFKFPRTPHLFDLGAVSSDDVLNNAPLSFPDSSSTHVVITEKIDGANLGFSLSPDRSKILVQNRSHYVNPVTHEQFKKLGLWVDSHRKDLQTVLDRDDHFAQRYVLFGEWMYATHSIPYTKLPSLFIAFDLYDRSTDTWADRESLSSLLSFTNIPLVPFLYEGSLPPDQVLKDMVQQRSMFWDGRVEGIYLKVERDGKVILRRKVVRGDFIVGNEHWTKGYLRVNSLETDYHPS
jgi:atypical dual specificity phosphatase